jgi:hypothetical protein
MKEILFIFSIALYFASLSFAGERIENPSAKALKKEAEILRRVVKLSGKGLCTGFWLEEGILATSNNCNIARKDENHVEINGIETTILQAVVFTNEEPTPGEKLFGSSEEFGFRANPTDLNLWLVDVSPLARLNLPKEPVSFAPTASEMTPEGVELLIAGYGPDAESRSRNEFPLGAAYVKTAKVREDSGFSLEVTASRRATLTTSSEAGQKLLNCTRSLRYFSDRKNDDAIAIRGDSGGPALVRDAHGEWALKGILSGSSFVPLDKYKVAMEFSLGGGPKRKLVARMNKSMTLTSENFADTLIGREASVVQSILKLDYQHPLPQSLQLVHDIAGETRTYYVNLSDPGVGSAVQQGLAELRKTAAQYVTPKSYI